MNNGTKLVLAAVGGLIAGGGIGYFAAKTQLEKKYNAEKTEAIQEILKQAKKKYGKKSDKDEESDDEKDENHPKSDENDEKSSSNEQKLDKVVTIKDGLSSKKVLTKTKSITDYKNYGEFYKAEVESGDIFKENAPEEYENDAENEEFKEMERRMSEKEHPKDDLDEAYIVDDIDDEPDYLDLDPIPVTLYLGDGVLAEDIGNKIVYPDENSIPKPLLDAIIEDERTDIYVKNPKGGVMYELTKTDEAYSEVMDAYHGGFDPNYE